MKRKDVDDDGWEAANALNALASFAARPALGSAVSPHSGESSGNEYVHNRGRGDDDEDGMLDDEDDEDYQERGKRHESVCKVSGAVQNPSPATKSKATKDPRVATVCCSV